LGLGLRRMALRILTTYVQQFLPNEANAFVFLQFKAKNLKEYDLVIRLAELALEAAPDEYKSEGERNLAAAHIVKGLWLTKKKKHRIAILEYEQAAEWFPESWQAWNNLGLAYEEVGEKEKSLDAFKKAEEIENMNL